MNAGDTAFMLISTAMVFLMTPGLAFFYGGMVRKRHVLSIMMQSLSAIGIITVLWVLVGYSLAFGTDHSHLIGGLDWVGLKGIKINDSSLYAPTIPHIIFLGFQLMFAIIAPAIMSGATAERLRYPAYILLLAFWSILVYIPLAHWVWGEGGWLKALGALDFAGGTVVHISSGISGLIAGVVVGKRQNKEKKAAVPHHLPYVLLGGGLLWFGWFGFNAGSALGANEVAVLAFITTHIAGASGMLGWVIVEWAQHGKPTVLGAVSGAVAGLVAITPAAGFVTPASALLIGIIAGGICYYTVTRLKHKIGYNDALDAFGIHGVGGTWGALATGIFASSSVNPSGANGFLNGGGVHLLIVQIMAVAVTYVFAGGMTWVILRLIKAVTPLEATDDEQELGLDLTQHGENAYPDFEFPGNFEAHWNL